MAVFGTVSPGFEASRDAFVAGQSSDEGGAQLTVYRYGVKVVDLWTGNDPVRGQPYDGNGITVIMSVTKALVATCAHLLAQRGLLDYDAPVCSYWSEFSHNGKEKITIRHVMSHAAGLAAWPTEAKIDMSDMPDHNKLIRVLEEMAPFWEPGTHFLYAGYTYGFILSELIRRITGKTAGVFLREEITGPLKLDLWLGLPEDQGARVIPGIRPGPTADFASLLPPGLLVEAYSKSLGPPGSYEMFNSREGHACEIPGVNAIGDARSLAKFFAHVIGKVDGKEPILSQETLQRAIAPQTDGIPFAAPFNMVFPADSYTYALGYQRPSTVLPMLGDSSFGHIGSGGRLGFADIKSGIAVGYICNNPTWNPVKPDPRWLPWFEALRKIASEK